MSTAPIICRWDGESLVPINQVWARRADERFVVGDVYPMEVREDRSLNTHNHFFAALTEAWNNLPEEAALRFSTVDHLRKFALIRCGYRDERSIVCASKAEAIRLAAFMRPMDDFAIVAANDSTVTVWTAKSQSRKAMGAKIFQESKTAVLEYLASMIGTDARTLAANTEAA